MPSSGLRILIIDDEKSIRNATSLDIRAEGHEVDAADCGRIALLKLREKMFGLVCLDLRLGDESSLDVLREIHRANSALPVIVFTAFASVETAVAAMQADALFSLERLEGEPIARVPQIAGNQEGAARTLKIDPATLYHKRKKWERDDHA